MKTKTNPFLRSALFTAATLALGATARAATFTWNGASAPTSLLWSDTGNWGGTAPAASFNDAFVFAGTTNVGTSGSPLNNDRTGGTATSITFNSGAGAFVIGGNAITLGGNVSNNESTNVQTLRFGIDLGAADRTFTTAAGGKLILSGALSRSAASDNAIISAGAGTLALTGTWSDTDVGILVGGGGTVDLTGATITGRRLAIGSGAIIVGAGSNLNFSTSNSSFGVNNATESSSYTQTGGSMTFGQLTIANGQGTNTTMNISAGTLNASTLRTSRGPSSTAADDSTTTASAINVTGTGLINTGNFSFGDGATGRYGRNTVTVGTGSGSTAEFRATTSFNWGNHNGDVRNNTVEVDGGLFSTVATSATNTASNAVLNIGNGGTLQARAASTNFLNGLDTFNIKNGGARIDTQANNITIGNNILNFSGATTASLTKIGAGILTLSGANTYGGGTLISGGTVALSGSGTLGATSGALTINNAILDLGATTQTVASVTSGNTSSDSTGAINGAGTLNVSGALIYQGSSGKNGAYASNPTFTVNSNVVVAGDTRVGRANFTIASGSYTTNRFISNSASADWGRVVISGGTVTATNGIDGSVNTTATFQLELNGGTLSTPSIRVANRDLNTAGPDSDNDANLIWNGTTVRAIGGNNANFVQVYGDSGNGSNPKQATYVSSGGAKIDTNGLNIGIGVKLLANPASSGGGLSKSGIGTLTLSGANTYTGATEITGGTLAIGTGGSIASTSQIIVGATTTLDVSAVSFTLGASNAQTLSGTGTVKGDMTVGTNGTLAIGNSAGTMTFNNNLSLGTGSVSNFEINSFTLGNYDLALAAVADTQSVAFNGGTLNLLFQSGFSTTGTVKIFDFNGYSGSGFTTFTPTGLASGFTATFDITNGIVTVIPEPSSALLGGLGLLALLRRKR